MLLLGASQASAALITVGDWSLDENTPEQQLQFIVSGGDAVQGVEFFLQVADGGPEAGGSIDGPAITGVDIFTGTIFDGNNTGEAGAGSLVPQFWQSGTTVESGTVSAQGLLATVTISTEGFFRTDPVYTWDLLMKGTLMGDSTFPGVDTVVENGSITLKGGSSVVPEPSTLTVWSLMGLTGALLVARRRKRPQ
jgi:hypothetical protein